jgi:hypothetical protein
MLRSASSIRLQDARERGLAARHQIEVSSRLRALSTANDPATSGRAL